MNTCNGKYIYFVSRQFTVIAPTFKMINISKWVYLSMEEGFKCMGIHVTANIICKRSAEICAICFVCLFLKFFVVINYKKYKKTTFVKQENGAILRFTSGKKTPENLKTNQHG